MKGEWKRRRRIFGKGRNNRMETKIEEEKRGLGEKRT